MRSTLSALLIALGIKNPFSDSLIRADLTERELQLAQLAVTTETSPGSGQFIPEILGTEETHDGPYVQIEGYGGDATISSMTVADSDYDWSSATIYDGKPIEGHFTAIVLSSGGLLAYRKRA